MLLTDTQIQSLYKFVESKYVRYIDVQHEIVDHLACAIEDKMQEQPSLSFESALSQVYSQYPITGFALLVSSKEKALDKYWRLQMWNALKTSIAKGSILAMAPLVIMCYCILSYLPYGAISLLAIALLSCIYKTYNYKKLFEAGQKLLITQRLLEYGTFGASSIGIYLGVFNQNILDPTFAEIIVLTIFHSLFIMFSFLEVKYIYPLVSQKLVEYEVKLG